MDRQFPPEIVDFIIEASLDPFDCFSTRLRGSAVRYSTLKNYCLLNKTWRAFSEPLLYKVVVIRSEETALLLLDAAKDRGGELEQVRDLRIRGIDLDDDTDARRIFSVVPGVVDLLLWDCAIKFDDLAHLKQLRRLDMRNVEDIGLSSTLILPSLHHLKLWECYPSPTAPFVLTRSSLPELRHLDICNTEASVDSLIPQLEAISCETYDDHSLTDATSLQLLHLSHSSYFDVTTTVLSRLPVLPPFICIDCDVHPDNGTEESALESFEQVLASTKEGLRVILICDGWVGQELEMLVKRAESRSIRVVKEKRWLNFDDAIDAMKRILAQEERNDWE